MFGLENIFAKSNTNEQEYKEIQDLNVRSIIEQGEGITKVRRYIEILFIDDNKLEVVERLKNYRYNITQKNDVDSITDVQAFDIILCDIRGVGHKFDEKYEGAALIKEIKKNYPYKYVIAYTGSSYDPDYNEFCRHADNTLSKGKRLDEWVDILDGYIRTCMDPKEQWKQLRQRLMDADIRISEIRRIEDAYVNSIENKDFVSFNKLIENMNATNSNSKVFAVLKDFLSSVIVKYIKELI